MQPVRRLATFDDVLALPSDARGEVFEGVIVVQPPPLPEHGRAQQALSRHVGGPFDDDSGRGGPGGWWILIEVDVQLDEHETVRPDVAGWRRERLPEPWGKRPTIVVPDWICEIISPSNEAHDRVKKRRLYARFGVPFYWIVDPAARTLEALQLVSDRWVEVGSFDDAAVARIAPFEAIELEVGRLFPPIRIS
ncbi:MAG: hypothetical protein NVS3B20_19220 [Polyangiales bacterium]